MSSHIRFNRTIRDTVIVSVQVHTEGGLRMAAYEQPLENPDKGLSRGDAKAAVAHLIGEIVKVRDGASKSKMEAN